MRKIRFRYIKENGKSTSVTVRCSMKRNASLISEALRHYQRLERQHVDEGALVEISRKKLDKQHRRHNPQDNRPLLTEPTVRREKSTTHHHHHFDPIQLRRKQCSSTLIDEDLPVICQSDLSSRSSSSSSSSGFRSHSNSSSELDDQDTIDQRTNVIRKIYTTELKYIEHLRSLVEVYLKQMRLRPDLFAEKQIQLLLGNIEEIFRCQQSFFESLKSSIDESQPSQSLVGQCFLLHKEYFQKYADYCINHPFACLELTQLEKNTTYRNFFETCRLQTKTTELKLDDFLLTPVQRIRQYQFQLKELFKWTPIEHQDYHHVQQALKTMRDVALYINEEKRRMECAEIIHKWQQSVEDWQGGNLIETSTQGLGHSEAYLHQHGKKESVILFLFDHVLIICHRDRRNLLSYVGRADLNHADIEDLPDGKEDESLPQLLSAWRLHDRSQHRTYLFSHRTALDKTQLMDALEYERAYVQENRSKGFDTPLHIRLATLKTQQYLEEQSCSATISLPPSMNRSISTILQTSSSPSSYVTTMLTTAIDNFPVSRCKSSLPRFVRCSSRDSSIDESFRSIRSRFRFWS